MKTIKVEELRSGHKNEGIEPAKYSNETFVLYSIPGFDKGFPEILKGKEIGSNKIVVKPGSILVSKINPRINRVWEVSNHLEGKIVASTEWIEIPKGAIFYPQFISIFFQQESVRQYLASNVSGVGGSLTRTNSKYVESLEIPHFSLDEQKMILKRFDNLNSKIKDATAELEFAQQKLELYRQSILNEAIRGKLVLQDPKDEPASMFLDRIRSEKESYIKTGKLKKEKSSDPIILSEVPFEIPKNWQWARLLDLSFTISDGDHQAPPKANKGIPFLVISDMNKGYINLDTTRFVPKEYFDKLSNERKPKKGDILYSVTGSYGVPQRVETESPFCFQRHIAIIKPLEAVSNDYLYEFLKSPFAFTQATACATGTAQMTVPIRGLREILVPIPPIHEQRRIVKKLTNILQTAKSQVALLEEQKKKISLLKQSILKKAFEGELI